MTSASITLSHGSSDVTSRHTWWPVVICSWSPARAGTRVTGGAWVRVDWRAAARRRLGFALRVPCRAALLGAGRRPRAAQQPRLHEPMTIAEPTRGDEPSTVMPMLAQKMSFEMGALSVVTTVEVGGEVAG